MYKFHEKIDPYIFNKKQLEFKSELFNFFTSKSISERINEIKLSNSEPDPREIYKTIAKEGLLSLNWPKSFGGKDRGLTETSILFEVMSLFGIPEVLFMLSIYFVGNLINLIGTKQQKEFFLPQMAAGELFSCILYSEKKAGSDLSNIETFAKKISDFEYEITGEKIWSMKTCFCDYGLCAVRTKEVSSKYDGISLFMIPLNIKGVSIKENKTIFHENFYAVELNHVKIPSENVIGSLNDGWSAINKALIFERTGLDYLPKIYFCICLFEDFIKEGTFSPKNENQAVDLFNFYTARFDASRLMTYTLIYDYEKKNSFDEKKSAINKFYVSRLASELVSFLMENVNYSALDCYKKARLSALYKEIPGVTLSAGTSQIILESISSLSF